MLKCQMPPKKRREPIDYPEGLGGREVCNLKTKEGHAIYKARTNEMAAMQLFLCAICGLFMCRPQFDHAAGRGFSGGIRDDRTVDAKGNRINAALCENCNLRKGSKRYAWVNGKYTEVVKIREVA